MTWGEFKAAVEAQGVQDSDVINWIDVSPVGEVYAELTQWADGTRVIAISDFPAD